MSSFRSTVRSAPTDDAPRNRILKCMGQSLSEFSLRVSIINRIIVKYYYWEGADSNGIQHEGALDSETLKLRTVLEGCLKFSECCYDFTSFNNRQFRSKTFTKLSFVSFQYFRSVVAELDYFNGTYF